MHSQRTKVDKADKVAAVVIWYQPIDLYVNSLLTYAPAIDHIWIIDNSASDNRQKAPTHESISYISLGGNFGIAHALNVGCRLARESGFDCVLTMDQDSSFEPQQITKHLESALLKMRDTRTAIVAPTIASLLVIEETGFNERKSAIASGNILNLAAWEHIGGFKEELFIDQVDHEFCFRLRKYGYRILLNSSTAMIHTVGDPIRRRMFGREFESSNHNHMRRYYQMRNSLYLRREYPEEVKSLIQFLKEVAFLCITIIIVEQNCGQKLWAMAQGAIDAFRGKYGVWEPNAPKKC